MPPLPSSPDSAAPSPDSAAASPSRHVVAGASLDVTVTSQNGYAVVSVQGEIDVATAPQLGADLGRVLDGGAEALVLDLEGVSFLDSTGLGVLVAAHRRTARSGGSLSLVCHEPRCLRVMEITGLTKLFDLQPSVAAATAVARDGD